MRIESECWVALRKLVVCLEAIDPKDRHERLMASLGTMGPLGREEILRAIRIVLVDLGGIEPHLAMRQARAEAERLRAAAERDGETVPESDGSPNEQESALEIRKPLYAIERHRRGRK